MCAHAQRKFPDSATITENLQRNAGTGRTAANPFVHRAVLRAVLASEQDGETEQEFLKRVDAHMIVRRPQTGGRLGLAREKIDPNSIYTLTEAAELTGIPRKSWVLMTNPRTNDGFVRVPCVVLPDSESVMGKRIKGSDVLTIVEEINAVPVEVTSLKDLTGQLSRSYAAIKQILVTFNHERFLPYRRNSDGKTVLIPLHVLPSDRNYYVDSRDAKSVAGDLDLGSTLLSWEDVQRYLESNGINLEEAQLKAILAQRIKTVKKERFFDYTSPDGLKTRIPVMLVTRACTPGHCYRIRQFDAVRLLNAAKRDKETFVKYLDAMREIGLAGPSECLSTKPRTFHLDGRDRGIRLYMKNLERYMKRDDAEFFGRWKELADHRESDYDGIRSWVCVSSEKEGRIQAYSRFLERLSIEATGVVLSVCTTFGLNIKIRELEGVYYVHRGEQSRTLRFFLNINNPCGRVRTKAVGSLAREIDALTSIGSADPHLVFRLWAARSVHNRDWRFEPDTAQCSFPQFDILIHSETAEQIFTRFQIEKLGRFFEKKCPGLVCTF